MVSSIQHSLTGTVGSSSLTVFGIGNEKSYLSPLQRMKWKRLAKYIMRLRCFFTQLQDVFSKPDLKTTSQYIILLVFMPHLDVPMKHMTYPALWNGTAEESSTCICDTVTRPNSQHLTASRRPNSSVSSHLVQSCYKFYPVDSFTLLPSSRGKCRLRIIETLSIVYTKSSPCVQNLHVFGPRLFWI